MVFITNTGMNRELSCCGVLMIPNIATHFSLTRNEWTPNIQVQNGKNTDPDRSRDSHPGLPVAFFHEITIFVILKSNFPSFGEDFLETYRNYTYTYKTSTVGK